MSSPDDPAAIVPNAVHVLLLDLDRTVGWKLDLMRETAEAAARIARLTKSVEAALWLVPEPERANRQRRLDASRARDAQGTGARVQSSDRVRLLHDFLATQRQSKVRSKEVLRYLLAHGIEIDAKAIARLMAAKCEQGLLTRLARGHYRIEKAHPVLAALARSLG